MYLAPLLSVGYLEKLLELIACLMEAEGDQVLDEGLGPLYLSG